MKQYFVTSDIHSYYSPLITALEQKRFDLNNPDHILCICGDLLDRGDQTVELWEFIKTLQSQGRLIYIKGNHESLLCDCMDEIRRGRIPDSHHFHNKTVKTICQFCGEGEWIIYDPTWRDKICEIMQPVLDFINENCVDYAEIGNYILVHGWIPCYEGLDDFRDATEQDWEYARWENGMAMWKNPKSRIDGKTIIVGHWHCSYGWSRIDQKYKEFPQLTHAHFQHSFQPWIKEGIIALDACCAYSGKLNCIVIKDEVLEDENYENN